ncbi:hypothetical protein SAMN05216312_111196 [Cohnella sp. OV330]|nr:hypothetical protein SAMN05216312_111196 [Cohnella sp. OV330]
MNPFCTRQVVKAKNFALLMIRFGVSSIKRNILRRSYLLYKKLNPIF